MSVGRGTVVLVDVYAPTARLAAAFRDAGYATARVRSTPEIPAVYRRGAALDGLCSDIVHAGDVEVTGKAVAALDPVAVLPGGELGVELADELSELLGLTTNGAAGSAARRDKYRMIETLRAAGLRATRQVLVTDEEQLRAFCREVGGTVVVKPVRSAGNDGVAFCTGEEQCVAAWRRVAAAVNMFGIRNEGVVAQEFLPGAEYVVNTVSRDGGHRATDLWKYSKIAVNGISNRVSAATSVPPCAAVREELVAYASAVLDALGIRHGPAHLEVVLTPSGPCLVEVGARLCGADTAFFAELAGGESQVGWTVDAYTDAARFRARRLVPHRSLRHVAMAFLTSPVEGVLRSYPRLPEVRALESFFGVLLAVRPGERLRVTVDDTSEPMLVSLAHPDEEVVARDLLTLHYLDGGGFYELEPPGGAP